MLSFGVSLDISKCAIFMTIFAIFPQNPLKREDARSFHGYHNIAHHLDITRHYACGHPLQESAFKFL